MNIVISFCLFYNDNDYILRYMNARFVKRFIIHSHFPEKEKSNICIKSFLTNDLYEP